MQTEAWPTQLRQTPVAPFFSETPEVVGIEITGRCQLRCRHCFNHSGPENAQELPLAAIEGILDDAVRWGVPEIRISGGEPTVHRQFRAIVAGCAARGLKIALNTNGIYAPDLLRFLETAPIELFLVSVDGLEENNDAIRGRGTFRRATASARALHAAGRRVLIACHVGAANCGDVEGLVTLAAEIGVDVKFSPIRPVGRAARELPGAVLSPAAYLRVVQQVTALRLRFSHIKILTDFDILRGAAADACQRDPKAASCKAGRTMVNIGYDGGIYPCAFFITPEAEFSAGSIFETPIETAWQSSPVFEPFRLQQKSTECQGCSHYQRRCVGGCPAIAHFATGHLDALDPTCFADLIPPPPAPSL